MGLIKWIATSKVSIVCGKMQNVIFIRRVPPYHQFWMKFFFFFLLYNILIYPTIHDSEWFTCPYQLSNPPIVVKMRGKIYNQKLMVRGDPSYKNDILHFSTHYANFRGCNSVNQPHLPNCTRFWVINMFSIAVEPSTNGQYGGLEPNWAVYPPYWVPVHPLTLRIWFNI